jgi:hypothetical protein
LLAHIVVQFFSEETLQVVRTNFRTHRL